MAGHSPPAKSSDQPTNRKLLAEFVGTFALVFSGCGGLMVSDRFPGSLPGWGIPLIFGLAIATMIGALGPVSGAHFNPAVTLAFTISGRLPKRLVPGYWLGQVLGALTAIGLLAVLLPRGGRYGATIPTVSLPQALGWETVLSFLLVLVILRVSSNPRAGRMMPATAIGATVALAAWIGGPVTGASMNPARSLAPALAEGRLDLMWIYLAGPLSGAIAAAVVYGLRPAPGAGPVTLPRSHPRPQWIERSRGDPLDSASSEAVSERLRPSACAGRPRACP